MSKDKLTALLGGGEGYRIGTVGRFEPGQRGPTAQAWIELLPDPKAPMVCSSCGEVVTQVHETTQRWIRDLPILDAQTHLLVPRRRVLCPRCGPKLEQLSWLGRQFRVARSVHDDGGFEDGSRFQPGAASLRPGTGILPRICRPRTGTCQPMSLLALITGIDGKALQEEGVIRRGNRPGDCRRRLRIHMDQAGLDPSYKGPVILPVRSDLFMMMSNHVYGVSGLSAQEMTEATLSARQELHEQVRALRKLAGPWENMRLVATAEQIGVREGRRIRGRYVVTAQDMREGIRHDDAICRVAFGIDVHALNRKGDRGGLDRFEIQPYDIPLRALLSADCENLLMAGRCISGDVLSHSSYRQTGDAAAMGEAAGACAALAALKGVAPGDLPARDVLHAIGYPGKNVDVVANTKVEP